MRKNDNKITFDLVDCFYREYEGEVVLTINHMERTLILDIIDDDFVYDGLVHSDDVLTYATLSQDPSAIESLPDKDKWIVDFYSAVPDPSRPGKYISDGNPFSSFTEAGEYILSITMPLFLCQINK